MHTGRASAGSSRQHHPHPHPLPRLGFGVWGLGFGIWGLRFEFGGVGGVGWGDPDEPHEYWTRKRKGFEDSTPTPYTLRPTPFTPHPTPHTLQPTPYTLRAQLYPDRAGTFGRGHTPLVQTWDVTGTPLVQN